jgi:hypothetical protein
MRTPWLSDRVRRNAFHLPVVNGAANRIPGAAPMAGITDQPLCAIVPTMSVAQQTQANELALG